MSLEQSHQLHLIKRWLKVVLPDFRLFSTNNLEPAQVVLDLPRKTIEIGENTPIDQSIGLILFQAAHALLQNVPEFSLFYGRGVSKWAGSEGDLIETLSDLGVKADLQAKKWAEEQAFHLFPSSQIPVAANCWSKNEWKDYFSSMSAA